MCVSLCVCFESRSSGNRGFPTSVCWAVDVPIQGLKVNMYVARVSAHTFTFMDSIELVARERENVLVYPSDVLERSHHKM